MSMNVLIWLMVDDFACDVDEQDVMGLGNVKDGVTGTVG